MAKKAILHKGAKNHVVLIVNVPVMSRPIATRTPYGPPMWGVSQVRPLCGPASPTAVPHVESRQRKRKADGDHSRSATPHDIPEGDPNGSLERSPDGRGNVRQREKRVREDRHDRKDGGQDDRHRDLDDRKDRRHKRDCEKEGDREWCRDGYCLRERSSCDRGQDHDLRHSSDRRHRRDHSPVLFSSDSDLDNRDQERHARNRKHH